MPNILEITERLEEIFAASPAKAQGTDAADTADAKHSAAGTSSVGAGHATAEISSSDAVHTAAKDSGSGAGDTTTERHSSGSGISRDMLLELRRLLWTAAYGPDIISEADYRRGRQLLKDITGKLP